LGGRGKEGRSAESLSGKKRRNTNLEIAGEGNFQGQEKKRWSREERWEWREEAQKVLQKLS